MTLEEVRLLRLVQGILVRNYVDTQRLDVDVCGGSVYIKGEFKVFDYYLAHKKGDPVEHELSMRKTLMHIEQQIRGIAEVNHLELKFDNWSHQGIQWVQTGH